VVSIVDVSTYPRFRRGLRYIVVVVVVAAAGAVGAIHIQQHILRRRAESLLSDIRGLNLRTSTFANAQITFRRWATWGNYADGCSERFCSFDVALNDFVYDHLEIFGGRPWLLRPYLLVGGRPARVRAYLVVRNGLVWAKGFSVAMEVTPGGEGEPWSHVSSYSLIGEARSVPRFGAIGSWAELALHPNYIIGKPGGCTTCLMVYANFTPYADVADVNRLMQFDLSCLTRWHPCRREGDLMPAAWEQRLRERPRLEELWQQSRECNQDSIKLLGRDAENVAVVEVIANRRETDRQDEPFQVATVRLVDKLKRVGSWNVGFTRELRLFKESWALTPEGKNSWVRPGSRLIILFDEGLSGSAEVPDIRLEQCGVAPATLSNRALVETGVRQDYSAEDPH
jgi:hypothetical protein